MGHLRELLQNSPYLIEGEMPVFHFHLRTREGLEHDESGLEYPDLDMAYLEARRSIPDILSDAIREMNGRKVIAVEIADARGTPLLQVPLSEVLDGTLTPRHESMALRRSVRAEVRAIRAETQRIHEELRRTRSLCSSMMQQRRELHSTLGLTLQLLAQAHAMHAESMPRLGPRPTHALAAPGRKGEDLDGLDDLPGHTSAA